MRLRSFLTRAKGCTTLCAIASVVAGGASTAIADAPNAMTYRGELVASNGLPYTGTVAVMARLYAAESGGMPLWSADLGDVAVMGGVLEASLDGTATALGGSGPRWLEFEVDGEVLLPRQMLTSAPYALHAWSADRLGGLPAANYLAEGEPVSATVSASAPAGAGEGQLWYDTQAGALKVFHGGAWSLATGLPTDGIGTVSNGTLTNAFMGVNHTWPGPAVQILDAEPGSPPAPATAMLATSEGLGSYLTGVSIQTTFGLNFNSAITMTLTPPASSGVGPIILRDNAAMLGGTYAETWTVANAPALAGLLGKQLAGTWTLAISDMDNNAVGSPPIGTLSAFKVSYDVVRADHLVAHGQLDIDGSLNVSGAARMQGEVIRKVQRFAYERGFSTSSGTAIEVTGSTFPFQKSRTDTSLLIHWNDNLRAVSGSGASRCEWTIRIDGQECTDPRPMRLGLYNSPADNNIHYPAAFVQTCNGVNGAPISQGNHTVSIWVRSISGDCWTGHGVTGSPGGYTAGLITIEEVY